ncbi:DUF6526 family protein [Paenibacillus nasutitermitis]|uniref:Uncharacterized protein n=1 Tax=Paenibacillus nasutitermitis TaxID=1652958 RepID=A0A916ZDI0_9BACL|nr:DUF6526 family protein [Paenibacillus nasutitermitis]GGD90651.1 hypothetical protein GCM10010911_56630 [Paenibacillus nasutitermitis]
MEGQNKGKTLRLDWSYHFVTLPLAMVVFIWSIVYLIQAVRDESQVSLALLLLLFSLCLVFAVTRIRIYATKTQDRIVRMEEQFRHHRLTGRVLDPKLSLSQIIALRNAGDDEFPALCERAVAENLKPADIRAAIRNWRPDSMRI